MSELPVSHWAATANSDWEPQVGDWIVHKSHSPLNGSPNVYEVIDRGLYRRVVYGRHVFGSDEHRKVFNLCDMRPATDEEKSAVVAERITGPEVLVGSLM